jgi:outer membrane assembly lipoprotein YfiO
LIMKVPVSIFRTNALLAGCVALLALLSGCGSGKPKMPALGAQDADKFLFQRGTEALNKKHWYEASEYFKKLIESYPQSDKRQDAKIGVGDAMLGIKSAAADVLAIGEFREFLQYYPLNPKADYALYRICQAEYRMVLIPERDQTATVETMKDIDTFLDRYPTVEASQYRLDRAQRPLQVWRKIARRVMARRGRGVQMVADGVLELDEGAVVHEGAVQLPGGVSQIPEGGRARVGQISATADREDDAVVAAVRIDVELGRPVTSGAAGAALGGRLEEELFPIIFAGGEVWERLGIRHDGSAGVVLGIEGLNAADELGNGVLDPGFVDRGGAENEVEEDRIFRDGVELRDEISEGRVAVGPAEPHLDRVLDRLGGLIFESVGAFVPKEMKLGAEPRIGQARGMAPSGAGDADARDGAVTESVGLLVAGAATHGVVAGEPFIVKEDAA